jgi:hypothetical protein
MKSDLHKVCDHFKTLDFFNEMFVVLL